MARPAFVQSLRAIQRSMTSMLDEQIMGCGVTEGQFEYLIAISENDGINQVELSKQLDVGKAAVTKAVKILELGGYIERKRNQADNRNYILSISPKGRKVSDEAAVKFNRVQAMIFSEFSLEELEELTALLERLRNRVSDLAAEQV